MLKQSSRNTARQRHGNKHRQQYHRRGNNRRGDIAHCVECSLTRRHSAFEIDLHGLDHHNAIIDHKTDSQNNAQKRDDIDRKSEQREEDKRTDQRYGHSNQRDQRRAPILDKEIDDNDDQHQSQQQSVENLAYARFDTRRGIDNRVDRHAVGKSFRELFNSRPDARTDLHCVAIRRLIDHEHS